MRNTIKRAAEPIAAIVAILALMVAMLLMNSCGTTGAADVPPLPSTLSAPALNAAQSPMARGADAKATPAPTDLQAALAAALVAKAALDKATADLTAAKSAVATDTADYAAKVQAYYDLANQVIPPPTPPPLNPDGMTADELMIVHAGVKGGLWESDEFAAACKAGSITPYVIDATATNLSPVNQRWVAYARACGPALPWVGVLKNGTSGSNSLVYHGKADDGKLIDVVRAFGHPKAAVSEEAGAEPDPIPATGMSLGFPNFGPKPVCPPGCSTCTPKGGK